MSKRYILVEPEFPIPTKSRNHKNFLPIGLLKIASYLKNNGNEVMLLRGINHNFFLVDKLNNFYPDEIWITSLFTYWAEYVKETVKYYRNLFPKAKIVVGGIYASLMPKHCIDYTGCDEVFVGILKEAEMFFPAYDLIQDANPHPIDYQIIHASRGCPRKCEFCGTWKIEPKFEAKKSIRDEIRYKKLVFYDNNFLCNPYIENILDELIRLKKEKKIKWCESQSGFDGRILLKKPYLAKLLKEAGFRYPRIAWDWGFEDFDYIEEQLNLLIEAGFKSKDIFVFMLYNWEISFEEMEKKRKRAWQWRVQISDCRFRPLNQTFDHYNPRLLQTNSDYYIHPKWSDEKVKKFRKNVRRQNICIRHNKSFYSKELERKIIPIKEIYGLKNLNKEQLKAKLQNVWFPED